MRRWIVSRGMVVILIAAAAAIAAGCAAPGAHRLAPTPKGFPPVLEHVTADVLAFSLHDTDPDSAAWKRTGLDANASLDELYEAVGLSRADVEPWIGDHAGIALRQFDVADTDGGTTLWFADVRDPKQLRASLDALEADGRAVQAYSDGVIVATSKSALDDFIDAADSYAVSERKAMSRYAAHLATHAPVGVVFRGDLLRTSIRQPVQDDPGMLEFARWATDSNVAIASRDGWLGVTSRISAPAAGVHITGAMEWVPDLAEDVDWGSVDASMLDAPLDLDADVAVALEDPGQHLRELVTGITRRNGQYATEQDVAGDQPRLELEPLLDSLDGDSLITWSRAGKRIAMRVEDAAASATDVEVALELAGLKGPDVDATAGDLVVRIPLGSGGKPRPNDGISSRAADARLAGKPPRPPAFWAWSRTFGDCDGPAAGWASFDGEGEMTFSIAVQHAARGCTFSPVHW